jgi:glycosyltransferase involved in cell wall biosynthesis
MTQPRFSIVTTCKGRLEHLRLSLPRMLAQPETEVIVVDYDCPDRTRDVVAREFPEARVVAVDNTPGFHLARARNLGAAVAQGDWLIFLDADVVIASDFVARLKPRITGGPHYRFSHWDGRRMQAFGSCVVARRQFEALEGYDEVIQDYGGEDNDFYFRLRLLGARMERLEADFLERIIGHTDAQRTQFYAEGPLVAQQRVNSAYIIVKNSLLPHMPGFVLSEPQRRQLYALVRDVVLKGVQTPDAPVQFTVDLPDDREIAPTASWAFKRSLTFDLNPLQRMDSRGGKDPD